MSSDTGVGMGATAQVEIRGENIYKLLGPSQWNLSIWMDATAKPDPEHLFFLPSAR
jgi:hypothetical protein